MSGHGYKVPPRSIRNIREIAEGVRKIVGDPRKKYRNVSGNPTIPREVGCGRG